MKMNAEVMWDVHQEWSVEEVELDGPKEGEVLVSFEATGLCHSDHHVREGDLPLAVRKRTHLSEAGHRAFPKWDRPSLTGF